MSDSPLSTHLSGYHDFAGLANLRSNAARESQGAVRQTAEQFEAHFIQQMMKTMREAVERSDLMENRDGDMFQDMMDKEIAVKMAQRSALGLADMIERQINQQSAPPTTHEALSAREKAWPPRPDSMPVSGGGASGLPMPARPDARRAYPLKGTGHE